LITTGNNYTAGHTWYNTGYVTRTATGGGLMRFLLLSLHNLIFCTWRKSICAPGQRMKPAA